MLRKTFALRGAHRRRSDGQSLVEYVLILLLIALAVFGSVGVFGNGLGIYLDQIVAALPF